MPSSALGAFHTVVWPVYLPAPLASSTTDAEGNFALSVPTDEQIFIFAQGQRLVGKSVELYEWRVNESDIRDRGRVLLENSNHFNHNTPVRIAGE